MSIALTPAELTELTNKTQRHRQIQALEYMGVPYKIRPDATIFVARASVIPTEDQQQTIELNIEALLHGIRP